MQLPSLYPLTTYVPMHSSCIHLSFPLASTHPLVHPSTYPHTQPSICPSIPPTHSSTHRLIHPCIHPFIHLSIHQTIHTCLSIQDPSTHSSTLLKNGLLWTYRIYIAGGKALILRVEVSTLCFLCSQSIPFLFQSSAFDISQCYFPPQPPACEACGPCSYGTSVCFCMGLEP